MANLVSVLILTLNEERNLPFCLESVRLFDDIVVFDSFSTDRTVEIAKAAGARVIQHKFDNWAAHQNWAGNNIDFKHPWVLYIDADERCTTELKDEIASVVSDNDGTRVAYYIPRSNYFMGRWLKHAMPPVPVMRLYRPERVRFERLVNPIAVIDGTHGLLNQYLVHYNFSKGLDEWISRHERYAMQEAVENLKEIREGDLDLGGLFALHDPVRRRWALKLLSMRLPFRPELRFVYNYFIRMGCLDGREGLEYCKLMKWYEGRIVENIRRLRQGRTGG